LSLDTRALASAWPAAEAGEAADQCRSEQQASDSREVLTADDNDVLVFRHGGEGRWKCVRKKERRDGGKCGIILCQLTTPRVSDGSLAPG